MYPSDHAGRLSGAHAQVMFLTSVMNIGRGLPSGGVIGRPMMYRAVRVMVPDRTADGRGLKPGYFVIEI